MLPAEEIQRSLTGAWRLLLGKADGLRLLDLSVDGFWNSFFSIVVALPAMIAGWSAFANDSPGVELAAGRFAMLPLLAIADLAVWILPLVALALVAKRIGIGDRFAAYVVASNWGTAVLAWLTLPPVIFDLFMPASEFGDLLSFVFFGASLVLGWRLTSTAIARGPGIATAVFAGTFFVSIVVAYTLYGVFGLLPS